MQTNSLSLELRQELDSSRFLVTLIITGLMGIASFQALPSLILGFVSELGFSERQVGQLSTFQLLGLGLGSIASVILLKFLDWRNLVRFGLALLLISDFAAALNIKMGRVLPLSVGLTFQLIGLLPAWVQAWGRPLPRIPWRAVTPCSIYSAPCSWPCRWCGT